MSSENITTVRSIEELKPFVAALEDGVMISVAFEDSQMEEDSDGS